MQMKLLITFKFFWGVRRASTSSPHRLLLVELAARFLQVADRAERLVAHVHAVNRHLVTGKNKLSINVTTVKERLQAAPANSLKLFQRMGDFQQAGRAGEGPMSFTPQDQSWAYVFPQKNALQAKHQGNRKLY